ncbi:hypothetical protein D8S78_05805 [Natrialba swarupiae]|nr:hypothetical protein [Natrialba swarupiae]
MIVLGFHWQSSETDELTRVTALERSPERRSRSATERRSIGRSLRELRYVQHKTQRAVVNVASNRCSRPFEWNVLPKYGSKQCPTSVARLLPSPLQKTCRIRELILWPPEIETRSRPRSVPRRAGGEFRRRPGGLIRSGMPDTVCDADYRPIARRSAIDETDTAQSVNSRYRFGNVYGDCPTYLLTIHGRE